MAQLYAVDPPETRVAVEHDGYTILYHRPSRTTHVLAPPAPELIAALAEGPADLAALAARLSAAHDVAADGDVAGVLGARLDELVASGLVRRA